jgi:hypothetical protein
MQKRNSTQATLSLSVARASLAAALNDDGVVSETDKNKPVTLPVIITVGDNGYSALYSGLYTARAGKTGRVR